MLFMYSKKKTRLYISSLVENPTLSYPSYYLLSQSMHDNEMLHDALIALHCASFDCYTTPTSYDQLFCMLYGRGFPIFKEHYVVGYFGGKLFYLEPNGWRAMAVTEDIFVMEHWLIYR
jgi:hypothetical protein